MAKPYDFSPFELNLSLDFLRFVMTAGRAHWVRYGGLTRKALFELAGVEDSEEHWLCLLDFMKRHHVILVTEDDNTFSTRGTAQWRTDYPAHPLYPDTEPMRHPSAGDVFIGQDEASYWLGTEERIIGRD